MEVIGKQQYDYSQAELEYITSKCSYKFLSEKYKIPMTSLTKVAKANKWVEKRKKHCENVVKKSSEKIVNKKASKLQSLIRVSDKVVKKIESALEDEDQFYRHIVTEMSDGESLTSERVFEKMDTKALRDVVVCLKDLTAVVRNLNDIPTAEQKESQKLAQERFLLEKKKIEEAEDKFDKNIIVEFENNES